MSDEPSSSSAAAAAAASSTPQREDVDRGGDSPSGRSAEEELAAARKKNREMVGKKRSEFLSDLLTSFDVLVYAELSTIYYMDCSFFRFLFRSLVQLVFLTPKPASFPDPARDRPVVGTILASNVMCILLHIYLGAPAAGEPTRGYLHGGLVMDFIGQKGPTNKLHLLVLDLAVLVLQLVQMSANATRKTLKTSSPRTSRAPQQPAAGNASSTESAPAQTASSTTPAAAPESSGRQDIDAEERGVRRSQEGGDDIELHDLNPAGSLPFAENPTDEPSDDLEASDERHALLDATTQPRDDSHIFDAFNSGQIVIANLNVVRTVHEQYRRWRSSSPDDMTDQERQQNSILRAEFAGRMLSLRFGSGQGLRRGV